MNFKNNGIPPVKPSFTGYKNDYMMQQPKRSLSLITLFLVIICTFVLAFLLFKNFDRMTAWFSSSVESTTGFQIWQTVSLSGILQADGDLISYTHTLTLDDTMLVGLKSRTLDLGIYSGMITIQGNVEKELNDIFIIEVTSISWTLASTWAVGQLLWSGSGIYFSQAGIYLPAEFGEKYTILTQSENGVLRFQNIVTNQIVSLSYFVCKTSDPNKNCTQLQQNIWVSAEKTVSTSRWDKLYKLEWVTSWYFNNSNFYGYFINDVPEQEVIDLVDAIILPNDYYIKNVLLSKLQTLCTDGATSLQNITTSSLGMDLNGLIINLQWPTNFGSATCKLFIDPSQAAWGTKISYISNTIEEWEASSSSDTESPSTSSPSTTVTIDTSVTQFPINLEKTMTFTSSTRWYSIVFPSMNIAYEAINVDKDLDMPGVRCSTQMNITKFSDKATMSDDPKIRIFTCTIKGTLNNVGNSIIQTTSANEINFIIQILDPAWAEFANNIVIK